MTAEIHDKTDERFWSNKVEDWDREFNDGDVVVAHDPQERLGPETICVAEIDKDSVDYVLQKGLFWDETEARVYADTLVSSGTD